MAIEDLYDHRVLVWRTDQQRGEHAEVIDAWQLVPVPPGMNAAIVPAKMRLADEGAGEHRAGRVEWYLHIDFNVEERDVLEVVAGPNGPSTWKVVSVTTPSGRIGVGIGGHHHEPVVEPWHGTLPLEES